MDFGLTVRDLHKSFRATPTGARAQVLRGVSFAAGAGEMVAITGASGAGKSTLLHLLGGLEAADKGSIKLGEFDVARGKDADLEQFREREVGFVFQFHHLLEDLSAAENVALPLRIKRVSRRESARRAVELLRLANLGGCAAHPVNQLSGGERQRVAVLRALVKEPRLVLADEPTGNLDAAAAEEIGSMLASFCRKRRAVVIVATHNEQLARACDRVMLLHGGTLRPG